MNRILRFPAAGSSQVDLAFEPDFSLGRAIVRPSRHEVLIGGGCEALEPRVMQVLVALGQAATETVTRDELIDRCWAGRTVSDDAINRTISRIRSLARLGEGSSFRIETRPGLGYRLFPEGEQSAEGPVPAGIDCPSPAVEPGPGPTLPFRPLNAYAVFALFVAGMFALVTAVAFGREYLSVGKNPVIAVLPFSDLSPSGDKAYFTEGVAEEILGSLASDPDIRVIGRSTALHFKGEKPDVAAIRRSLGVTHILEGSALIVGSQLRMNVRLVSTAEGTQIWSNQFQRPLTDIFAVQDEIARTVAQRLKGALGTSRVTTFGEEPRVEAYDLYLAARSLMRTRSPQTLGKALDLARNVVAVDPSYAPGHALYAELLFLLSDDSSSYGTIPVERARAIGIPHARKAVELAPDRAEGYGALGLILPRHRAIEPLRRAIALDPARAELRVWLGVALTEVHRVGEAFEQYRAAAEVEPLWPVALNRLVQTLSASGRQEEARAEVQKYLARGGEEAQALRFMTIIARSVPDLSQAIRYGRAAMAKDPDVPFAAHYVALDSYMLGLGPQALAVQPQDGHVYSRLLFAGDRSRLLAQIRRDGAGVWSRPDYPVALYALGAVRNWPALAALYDSLPAELMLCRRQQGAAALVMLAHVKIGRTAKARQIGSCLEPLLDQLARSQWRSTIQDAGSHEFAQASFAAVTGRNAEALNWLDQAVEGGWLGEYFSSRLSDFPQFDVLANHPLYTRIQKRIDAKIATERTELLASPIPRSTSRRHSDRLGSRNSIAL